VSQIPGLTAAVEAAAGLSLRKRECLELHLKGASYRWIARQLGLVAHTTAREHVTKTIFKDRARDARGRAPVVPEDHHTLGWGQPSDHARKETPLYRSRGRTSVALIWSVASLGGAEVVSCRGKDEEEYRCT
jgi:hypothetical protein